MPAFGRESGIQGSKRRPGRVLTGSRRQEGSGDRFWRGGGNCGDAVVAIVVFVLVARHTRVTEEQTKLAAKTYVVLQWDGRD